MENLDSLLNSKSFCVMPWVHLATEPNGDVKICCLSNTTVKNNQKQKFNLGQHNVDEIYNSESLCNIRKRMLNGEKIPECNHCWVEESAGGISQRMNHTTQWITNHPEFVDTVNESLLNNFQVSYSPKYYDFRFGNLCNLKCRSCGSLSSNQINKEYKELKLKHPNTPYFNDHGDKYDNINSWYKSSMFKSNIYGDLNSIEQIYLTGGEPTLIEENHELLENIIKENRQDNVKIIFNTNMTNLRNDFYGLISQFKQVEIYMSVDGYKDTQEYLRYPSNWTQIDQNIRKLMTLPTSISIVAVPVIQITNLGNIVEFFEYIESLNTEIGERRISLLPIILNVPTIHEISILPLDYKLKCWEMFEQFISESKWCAQDDHFLGRFNNIKSRCETDNFRKDLISQYMQFTMLVDRHRTQHLKNINLPLFKLLNELQ